MKLLTLIFLAVTAVGCGGNPLDALRFAQDYAPLTVNAQPSSKDTFYKPIAVTLYPSEPDAVIYFTIDGSAPDITSPIFDKPIYVGGHRVIRFYAALGTKSSASYLEDYTIVKDPSTP